MAKFEKYSRWCYAEMISGTPPMDGYPTWPQFLGRQLRSSAPHTAWLPWLSHGRPQAWATGAGGRGYLPLPHSPQSDPGYVRRLRWLAAHYLHYAVRPSLAL